MAKKQIKAKLSPDDRRWGYPFGVDGTCSVRDAAEFLGMCRASIYNLADEGMIRKRRLRGRAIICRRSLQTCLQQHTA